MDFSIPVRTETRALISVTTEVYVLENSCKDLEDSERRQGWKTWESLGYSDLVWNGSV